MKNVAVIVVSTLMWGIGLLIVMTVSGRMNRSMELKSGFSSIVEETVANMKLKKQYSIGNTNEFLADLTTDLSVQLDSDSDILIEVAEKDVEQGMLSVRVTETFSHPNGKPGTVTDERTVLFNKLEEPEPQEYKVQFIADGEVYKACTISEGDRATAPVNPVSDGKRFLVWKDGNGYLADFTQPVEQDRTYFAEWT